LTQIDALISLLFSLSKESWLKSGRRKRRKEKESKK
jgi:hypothetical protein